MYLVFEDATNFLELLIISSCNYTSIKSKYVGKIKLIDYASLCC